MFIPISNSDPRPLYEQISESIKEKIFSGELVLETPFRLLDS